MNNVAKVKDCLGCGVCSLKCVKQAILMQYNVFGQSVPKVEKAICANCGKCIQFCPTCKQKHMTEKNIKKAYIAVNNNTDVLKKSASGGVAAALAYYWIMQGGSVCGACGVSPRSIKERFHVEHILIHEVMDIEKIQGSKYVQSDIIKVLPTIEKQLKEGKRILFFGTSCQVDAVKTYLGREYENLNTVDLICHGVIGSKMFDSYLRSIEMKEGNRLLNVSFRTKEKEMPYTFTFTFTFTDENNNTYVKELHKNKSSYYRMFLGCIGYRKSCYRCKYANIDKPADITLGDYYEAVDDYPELFENNKFDMQRGISSVIIHNKKGMNLLNSSDISTYLVDTQKVVNSHVQLQHPSRAKRGSAIIMALYRVLGWKGVNLFYRMFDIIALFFRKID